MSMTLLDTSVVDGLPRMQGTMLVLVSCMAATRACSFVRHDSKQWAACKNTRQDTSNGY